MRKTLLALVLLSAPASALSDKPYLPASYNALEVVPPPPSETSVQHQHDMAEVLDMQVNRTDALIRRAENDRDYLGLAAVLGNRFTPAQVPLADEFIRKVTRETSRQVDIVKDCWQRQRPFVTNAAVKPPGRQAENMRVQPGGDMQGAAKGAARAVCPPSRPTEYSFSYPSGAASTGLTAAILLAAMVPEKTSELYTRAWEFGENRILLGVHFPSDVSAGRLSAAAAIALMTQNPAFNQDLADARKELRAVLGYAH